MSFCKAVPALVLVVFSNLLHAQIQDSVKAHIDSCLHILETNSLYTSRVDWPTVKKKVYAAAQTAGTRADCFRALRIAFDALGDKHAAYYHYANEYRLNNNELQSRYNDSIRAGWKLGPYVIGKMMNNIAYVRVPFMGVTKQDDINQRANWLYRTVADLRKKKPSGWIIDLRLNGGGNVLPMLAGLAPFLNDGIVSYYIDHANTASDEYSLVNGEIYVDRKKSVQIDSLQLPLREAKLAVLVGAGTASSGELVAAVLKQRPSTQLFGDSTAGLANATGGFVLGENVYFLISTARIADKNKKALPEVVQPAVVLKGNDAFNDLDQDQLIHAASKWLLK